MPRIITLLSDFGDADGYVGQMKGALLSVAPGCTLVDLTHEIPPQAVGTGAFILESAYSAFPERTIHLAVVDPGVGSSRRAIVVETQRYLFVGPDNGLLGRALARETVTAIHALAPGVRRQAVPAVTFDGRDLFAPAAALAARDVPLSHLGPRIESFIKLADTAPRPLSSVEFEIHVVHVDRFGNVVLDLRAAEFPPFGGCELPRLPEVVLVAAGRVITRRALTYSDVDDREPFLLVNSTGYLELACRDGNAATRFGLAAGDRVRLRLAVTA